VTGNTQVTVRHDRINSVPYGLSTATQTADSKVYIDLLTTDSARVSVI